jgi:eukaryotic-like serine/threonine-protein kinase
MEGAALPSPTTPDELSELIVRSQLVGRTALHDYRAGLTAAGIAPTDARGLASLAVRDGLLTTFQADLLMQGKWKNFFLGGKYKVLEHLGAGGMGTVLLCEHRHMRRRVALKLLPPDQQDPGRVTRFQREAQAIAMLNHPNIVRAYDIDEERGLHFLVMEYIDGVSLQWLVEARGPLSVPRAVNYIAQAASGLQHAAERGLVHRDIKPSNLMLDWTGTVKVLDLGLARFVRADSLQGMGNGLTGQTVLGTADYLAPEQARDSAVDFRADIYSLGAVAYYMLTGQPPFNGGNVATKLVRHQTEKPRPVTDLRPDVPEGVSAVVARMLAKQPGERPQSPAQVVVALRDWVTEVAPPTEDEMPTTRYSSHRDIATSARGSTMAVMSKSSRDLLLRTMAAPEGVALSSH